MALRLDDLHEAVDSIENPEHVVVKVFTVSPNDSSVLTEHNVIDLHISHDGKTFSLVVV